ncbi:unnamed protein product [Trichogramma brassicae]|uniref:Uncharacterized protein n=1 Tax=Trichogramma brassicae TaxID=86971 RepID=A0A6H5INH1_9HYME|nr:unnamed protein product [Trichogramma brassicae]
MLQLKKGVENASDLGEELGKVLGTAATASALLHTSTIEIKDLDDAEARPRADRLGELPHPCSRGGCALLPLLEPLVTWPLAARVPTARSSATDAAKRAPKQRTAKANHRAFSAENEELTTIVTRPQARAALRPGRSPRTADDENPPAQPQSLRGCPGPALRHHQRAAHRRNTRTLLHPTHGSPMPTAKQLSGCMEEFRCRSAQREYIPTSRGPESAEFSFSASTLHQDSLRGNFPPSLPTSPRRPAAEGPLLLRGTSTHGRRSGATTRPSSSRSRTTGLRAGPRRAGATGGTPVLSMWTVSLPSCPAHRSLPGPRRIWRRASCPSSPAHVMPRCPRQILAAVRREPVYWWTAEIADLRRSCQRARRLFQRSRGRHDERNPQRDTTQKTHSATKCA